MRATADRPSAAELDQLAGLLSAPGPDRGELIDALRRIEQGLRDRARELDRSGGLLDEADKAHRMSLAREDERLREEIGTLLADVQSFRHSAAGGIEDEEVRRRGSAILARLRGPRDAEASLVLESVETEGGAGD